MSKDYLIYAFCNIIVIIFMYKTIEKRSKYPLHCLQLEGYDNKEYSIWLRDNLDKLKKFKYVKAKEEKSPLVMTDRANRLLRNHLKINIRILLLTSLFSILVFRILNTSSIVKFLIAFGFLALADFILYFYQYELIKFSNKISLPIEIKINQGFYNSAQNKIKKYKEENNLKVLGITGSFGKTSVKFISNTILSEKLKVKNTPSSFNTPMGLSKIINNELEADREVFIAELGAKIKGEIDEVAKLVQPDIGIITAIGKTHMHLFKTIENIQNTKYELIENLKEDGVAIFNYDNDYVKVLADKTSIRTLRYGLKDVDKLDVYAKNIEVSERGSKFTLVIKELGEIKCQSKLLGEHNISNILASASAAYVLGLSLEEIARGIAKVEPVEHRLNIVDSGTGVTVIDDAFNSNPVGFRAALEVLSSFKSGRKIIITPGMVELGDYEEKENYEIGKEIAKKCDFAILVGKKRTKPIFEGINSENYNMENVFVVNSLKEATDVLGHLTKVGDIVLFENDLPDNYSEQ